MDPTFNDYLDLIPGPNRIASNFMAWVQANTQPNIDTAAALRSMVNAFHIDFAVGKQLDRLGELLGVKRLLNFDPGEVATLDDDIYRIALKARILINNWHGTIKEVYDFWGKFLPAYTIAILDNQDMTMTVFVAGMPLGFGSTLSLLREMTVHGYFVPKPAGVRVNYVFIDEPLFAYNADLEFLKGYNAGHWLKFET